MIVVYAALGMPTTLYIMMSYYKTISPTLEEAAYIDGAGFFRTFVQIILPLTRPAFATAGVLQFLLCWNEFQFALTLTTGTEKERFQLRYIISRVRLQVIMELCLQLRCLLQFQVLLFIC